MARLFSLCAVVTLFVVPAVADWNPGQPYKMHFPQLPDPEGWDVMGTFPKVLADDWLCTETGPVTDIHFWGSWREGLVGQITAIDLSIHANNPGPPSTPVNPPLWARRFFPGQWRERVYGTGPQGWFNPNTGFWRRPDHSIYYQYNFVGIEQPFTQLRGTIYWLDVSVHTQTGYEWGWKTSLNHFMDDAVFGDYPNPQWRELRDPITGQSLDLAFVITPEPGALVLLAVGSLVLLRQR
ncbi:MAG: hypothetical protein AB1716_07785 [Planctomycetota bacterium]